MSTRTCPTCSQPTRGNEGVVQARIASRPDAGPAQARHIGNLERQLAEAQAGIASLKRVATNREPWLVGLGRFLFEYRIVRFPDDVLAWRDERDEAQGKVEAVEKLQIPHAYKCSTYDEEADVPVNDGRCDCYRQELDGILSGLKEEATR